MKRFIVIMSALVAALVTSGFASGNKFATAAQKLLAAKLGTDPDKVKSFYLGNGKYGFKAGHVSGEFVVSHWGSRLGIKNGVLIRSAERK
jgi:hypothetical protein